MRCGSLPFLFLPLICLSAPVFAQQPPETESDYLQHRAATLNERIDIAVRAHKLSKTKAARLHLAVGRVQTSAGNFQTRNGTIGRPDADAMNQQLTDVERVLPPQP